MSEGSNRRTFLRDAFQRAAQGSRAMVPGGELILPEIGGPTKTVPAEAAAAPAPRSRIGRPTEVEPLPAEPSERRAKVYELFELAARHGLEARLAELPELARASVRLNPDPEATESGSHGAGVPVLPPSVSWPRAGGEQLTFLGRVEMTSVRETPPFPPVSAECAALLLFVAGVSTLPGGHGPVPACVLPVGGVVTERAEGPVLAPAGRPLRVSTELTLPRAWAAGVRELGLDGEEREAWERLRLDLASSQGVDPQGAVSGGRRAHHLFGYPDETSGSMPRACDGAEIGAGREAPPGWRLIAQLDSDPEAGWGWGGGRRRLFVWQRADAVLAPGEPASAWAIVR